MFRLMLLIWCAFLWVLNCRASDISYLDRGSILEKDIAAVFNKVAYGGVTTTKRSISSKYLPVSGTLTTLPPPVTSILVPSTTPLSSDTPKTSANTDLKPENKTDRARHRQDLTSTHSRNQNVQYTTNLPPFVAPKTSFPISYTTPSSRGEVPSYIPPVRSFFTPPLPPEYANPFADKPTLRGSNSDGSITTMRRPQPPPRPPHEIYGRERIPLRPPDLGPEVNIGSSNPDRKKPLNTPSFNRPPDPPGYDPIEHETSSSKLPQNDTAADFDFVPVINYPSVSRILSGSNGRKDFPDVRRPHVESRLPARPPPPERLPPPRNDPPPPAVEEPPPQVRHSDPRNAAGVGEHEGRTSKEDKSPAGLPDSIDVESKVDSIVSDVVAGERPPDPGPPPPPPDADANLELKPSRKNTDGSWLLAWDIHVYLIATLFLVLAVCSLVNLVRINSHKRLLSHGYYVSVHALLLVIGTLRSLYLFLDAYNMRGLLPKPFSDLILNVVSPLITSTFLVLFLFILKASKVDLLAPRMQHPLGVAIFVVFHVFLCVAFELTSEIRPELRILPLIGQCVYVVVLVIVGLVYLYIYKALAKSVARKSENIFGGSFTDVYKPTIAVTIRTSLATALLALLMAAIQLYGVFGVLDGWKTDGGSRKLQWLWWGYQFSVRFVEASMCFLMLWAGVQSVRCHNAGNDDEKNSDNSGFALFRCGQCTNAGASSDANDDIYPAVCVTNQAIHDYTLRTGKKVYDDSFPLNSLHHAQHAQQGVGARGPRGDSPRYEEPSYAMYDAQQQQQQQVANRFKYDDSNFSTNERRSAAAAKKVSPSYDSDEFCGVASRGGQGGQLHGRQREVPPRGRGKELDGGAAAVQVKDRHRLPPPGRREGLAEEGAAQGGGSRAPPRGRADPQRAARQELSGLEHARRGERLREVPSAPGTRGGGLWGRGGLGTGARREIRSERACACVVQLPRVPDKP